MLLGHFFFFFLLAMLIQYNFHHCWMKGSKQTRLINTQIWTFSIIMVVNVFLVLLSERFEHSKCSGRIKKSRKGKGGRKKTEISGFVEYLATLAPDPGLFLGFTFVQGNVSHVSTLFWLLLSTQWVVGLGHGTLDRGGSGSAFTSAGQEADKFCGGAASSLSRGPRFQASWIKLHRHSAHHKCTVIDMVLVVPAYTNSLVS